MEHNHEDLEDDFFPLQMGYFQVNHGIVQGVAAAALSFDVLRMH